MKAYKIISEKVKECPFCKGTKIIYSVREVNAISYYAYYGQCYCDNCKAQGPRVRWVEMFEGPKQYATIEREAINLWNKRGNEK